MGFFCRHKWAIIDKTTTESPLEAALRLQCRFPNGASTLLLETFTVTVLACEKCGAIDKTTVSNLVGRQ